VRGEESLSDESRGRRKTLKGAVYPRSSNKGLSGKPLRQCGEERKPPDLPWGAPFYRWESKKRKKTWGGSKRIRRAPRRFVPTRKGKEVRKPREIQSRGSSHGKASQSTVREGVAKGVRTYGSGWGNALGPQL